jgi:surfactin synthase thioesterase subunit
MRLYCLPYSGASAMVYAKWQCLLPSWLQVCPLELPGRGKRYADPLYTDIGLLSRLLAGELAAQVEDGAQYVLYGHSLGALLSWHVVQALVERKCRLPAALIVSGTAAPSQRDDRELALPLSDERLVARLQELGGTPAAVFDNPQLLELVLPLLRADFQLCGSHTYSVHAPLDLPLLVMAGHDDIASAEQLQAWRHETYGPFAVQMFDGGHFFISSAQDAVLTGLQQFLEPLRAVPPGSPSARVEQHSVTPVNPA